MTPAPDEQRDRLRLDYWTACVKYIETSAPNFSVARPSKGPRLTIESSSEEFRFDLAATFLPSHKHKVAVELKAIGDSASTRYRQLRDRGEPLLSPEHAVTWQPNKNRLRIEFHADMFDRGDWQRQFEWYVHTVRDLKRSLGPLLVELTEAAND